MKDRHDLVRSWIRKAESDLAAVELALTAGQALDTACFHAQQAGEKYLKAYLEELKKAPKNTAIYNKVGSLLFKVDDIKKLKKELTEHQETFGVRMKTLERQENQLKERYTELQKDISKAVQELE